MGASKTETFEPKIYVACLAAYNSGILYGAWIDAAQDEEEINAEIQEMLEASPIPGAEEYAIHDYEDFADICIAEFTSIKTVAALAAFVVEHGRLGAALYEHLGDLDEARETLTDRYCGVFSSLADWMEELTLETTEIPNNLLHYIDWERMARDAEMSGDVFAVETAHDEVHVFWVR
jgi:antirestriction protein